MRIRSPGFRAGWRARALRCHARRTSAVVAAFLTLVGYSVNDTVVVNGEVRESRSVRPDEDSGSWRLKVEKSSWVALMVRGHYADKPEIIAAHSSPVMIPVEGSDFFSPVDALTMLDQIEGALAYVDTVGTRAEDAVYKRVRMRLTAAYRTLHNELHKRGHFHEHSGGTQHAWLLSL